VRVRLRAARGLRNCSACNTNGSPPALAPCNPRPSRRALRAGVIARSTGIAGDLSRHDAEAAQCTAQLPARAALSGSLKKSILNFSTRRIQHLHACFTGDAAMQQIPASPSARVLKRLLQRPEVNIELARTLSLYLIIPSVYKSLPAWGDMTHFRQVTCPAVDSTQLALKICNSIRRFSARPSSVAFEAAGSAIPYPLTTSRSAATP